MSLFMATFAGSSRCNCLGLSTLLQDHSSQLPEKVSQRNWEKVFSRWPTRYFGDSTIRGDSPQFLPYSSHLKKILKNSNRTHVKGKGIQGCLYQEQDHWRLSERPEHREPQEVSRKENLKVLGKSDKLGLCFLAVFPTWVIEQENTNYFWVKHFPLVSQCPV